MLNIHFSFRYTINSEIFCDISSVPHLRRKHAEGLRFYGNVRFAADCASLPVIRNRALTPITPAPSGNRQSSFSACSYDNSEYHGNISTALASGGR